MRSSFPKLKRTARVPRPPPPSSSLDDEVSCTCSKRTILQLAFAAGLALLLALFLLSYPSAPTHTAPHHHVTAGASGASVTAPPTPSGASVPASSTPADSGYRGFHFGAESNDAPLLPLPSPHPSATLAARLACWTDASAAPSGAWFEANSHNSSCGSWVVAPPLYDTSTNYYGEVAFRTVPAPTSGWRWQSAGWCAAEPTRPFSRADACALLSGHELLVVGDSLNEEIFGSLINFLSATQSEFAQPYARRMPNAATTCLGALSLNFVRNDRLSLVDEAHIGDFYEFPWIQHVQRAGSRADAGNATLVLLNRGAHYENDTIVLAAIEAAINFVVATAPEARILWRTTPHGHPEPRDFNAQPLRPGDDLSADALKALPFDWGLFPAQSVRIVELIRRRFPRVTVLDVGPLLALRPDSHNDGLHYGIPGPLDVFVETLLHFLPEIVS